MKLRNLVGDRFKERPSDCVIDSHAFSVRGGYIKYVANGIFSLYPPMKRITKKIENIIREEMDAIDGQEVLFPVALPGSLWEESGRFESVGEELLRFKDRNDSNMLLFKRSHKKAPEIKIPFIAKVNIELDWPGTLNITVYEKSMIGYVLYQGSYMYFDKDGVIVESSTELVEDIPKVNGLDYGSIVLYNTLDVTDKSVFPSIMNLKQYLDKYEIEVEEIKVSEDTKFSIDIGEITVLLGHDDKDMSMKIFELSCMMKELEGKRGTLDMEEYTEDSQYIILTEK